MVGKIREKLGSLMKKQLIVLISLGLPSSSANAENLLQVYRHAQHNDAQYKASEAGYMILREKKPQALSALKPQVNLSANASYTAQFTGRNAFRPDDNAAFLNLGYTLNLTQTLYRKTITTQIKQADITILKAQASLELDRQNLMIRVVETYLAYLKAKDDAKFAQLETKAFERQLRQVNAFFDAERAAITDVKEARARYDLARSREVIPILIY
jgi:outer membrane protein